MSRLQELGKEFLKLLTTFKPGEWEIRLSKNELEHRKTGVCVRTYENEGVIASIKSPSGRLEVHDCNLVYAVNVVLGEFKDIEEEAMAEEILKLIRGEQ